MTDLPYWTLHEAPPDSPKKWVVRVPTSSGRGKVVLFGARGYEDFTTHHDVERRERYRTRHQRDRLDDPYAPGFWSMWALWGESDDLDTAFAAAVSKAKKLLTRRRRNPEESLETDMVLVPRHNPVREQFNFSHYEEYASRLTDDQLHHAIIDALDVLKAARTWDDGGAGEAKYLDQLSVLRREQRSRGLRHNPEWARKVGGALYRGTRRAAKYAKEVGTDLYHGAREAHRSHRSNPEFDQYEFRVASAFLPALFNGDTSGLSPDDEDALDRFYKKLARLGVGHFAVIEEDAGFGRDEITGLGSDRALVAWMVPTA